jgi:low affinity Fe/Cu permease
MESKRKNTERLKEHNGEDPFRVPDGYFEHFPERVMEKIRAGEDKTVPRMVPFHRKGMYYAAAVIAAVVILTGGYLFLQRQGAPDVSVRNNVTTFVMTSEIDEQMLMEFMEQENIIADTLPVISEEDSIIDYLVQEGVDESLLAELY